MPSEPIEFWFDFSSPYSYLASERIDDLAAAVADIDAPQPGHRVEIFGAVRVDGSLF